MAKIIDKNNNLLYVSADEMYTIYEIWDVFLHGFSHETPTNDNLPSDSIVIYSNLPTISRVQVPKIPNDKQQSLPTSIMETLSPSPKDDSLIYHKVIHKTMNDIPFKVNDHAKTSRNSPKKTRPASINMIVTSLE